VVQETTSLTAALRSLFWILTFWGGIAFIPRIRKVQNAEHPENDDTTGILITAALACYGFGG